MSFLGAVAHGILSVLPYPLNTGNEGQNSGGDNNPTSASSGSDSASQHQSASSPASNSKSCCYPPYQLHGDMLLETGTGRVWRLDSKTQDFLPIKKYPTQTEYLLMEAKLEDALLQLDIEAERNIPISLPKATRSKMKKEMTEKFVVSLRKELAALKPK